MAHVLLSLQVHLLCWCDVAHLIFTSQSNPIYPIREGGVAYMYASRRGAVKRMERCTSRVHSMSVSSSREWEREWDWSLIPAREGQFICCLLNMNLAKNELNRWSRIEYFKEWYTPCQPVHCSRWPKGGKERGKDEPAEERASGGSEPSFSFVSWFLVLFLLFFSLFSSSSHCSSHFILNDSLLFFCLPFVCLFVVIIFSWLPVLTHPPTPHPHHVFFSFSLTHADTSHTQLIPHFTPLPILFCLSFYSGFYTTTLTHSGAYLPSITLHNLLLSFLISLENTSSHIPTFTHSHIHTFSAKEKAFLLFPSSSSTPCPVHTHTHKSIFIFAPSARQGIKKKRATPANQPATST